MIDTPYVAQSQEQLTARIHLTVPKHEIQRVMGPGLLEVKAAIASQGIKAIGPWFTRHLQIDPEVFDFEICLPVAKEVTATGRVQPGRMLETKVVRTIYRGPYEGLREAWGEFGRWIEKQGYQTGDEFWECYLAGPEKSADPSEWETELNRVIK
jgi:effector-binding domain-containing protein